MSDVQRFEQARTLYLETLDRAVRAESRLAEIERQAEEHYNNISVRKKE